MRSVKPESLLQRDCLSGPWAWHPAARGIDWDAVLRPPDSRLMEESVGVLCPLPEP